LLGVLIDASQPLSISQLRPLCLVRNATGHLERAPDGQGRLSMRIADLVALIKMASTMLSQRKPRLQASTIGETNRSLRQVFYA
jgi:hypothetical protein